MAMNTDFDGIFPEAASQSTPQGLKRSFLKTFEAAPVQWLNAYCAAKVVKLSDDAVWAEMSRRKVARQSAHTAWSRLLCVEIAS